MCSLSTVCFSFYVPSHLYPLNVTMHTYTYTSCTHHTCSSSVLLCSVPVCLLNVLMFITHAIHITTMLVLSCIVGTVLIVHHMHRSACFTCYICPHIHVPHYMSALFSTCYLFVSTMQHIHQAYMYMHHTYIHLLSVVCYITKNKKDSVS